MPAAQNTGIRAVGEVHGRLRWESIFQSLPEEDGGSDALIRVTKPFFSSCVKLGAMMMKMSPLGALGD